MAALLSCALAAGGAALAAQPPRGLETGSISAPAGILAPSPYELRIEVGRKGSERLWLAARLRENGGLIRRPVSWTVRKLDAMSGRAAAFVFSGDLPIADFHLSPGEYEVRVRYGYRRALQRVSVLPGQFISMTFILDVGGVRAMTKLEGIGAVHDVRSEQRFFALTGKGRARLVARNSAPGKILRLAAGDYRIESLFRPGNARAVARVRVKPGVLSTLSITASAGWARMEPQGTARDARWILRDDAGLWSHEGRGPASVILAPGAYVMEAQAEKSGEKIIRRFTIAAGERRTIRFGKD